MIDSLGLIDLPLETPGDIPTIHITCNVIQPDVPALPWSQRLEAHSLTADTVRNRLVKRVILGLD